MESQAIKILVSKFGKSSSDQLVSRFAITVPLKFVQSMREIDDAI